MEKYTNNGRTYPSWIPNHQKDQMVFRFLSSMSDHYNKTIHWIKKSYRIYTVKFEKIPFEFLQEQLGRFLADKMGTNQGTSADFRFAPSPALIYAFIRGSQGFNPRWEVSDFGKFCKSCRSSSDGKEGGFRQVYIRYVENNKRHIRDYIGTCDCVATSKATNVRGLPYMSLIEVRKRKYKDIEAFFSYWCDETERLITAKEQSSETWERRLLAGYVGEDETNYYPIWEHQFWRTAVGISLSELLGWEMEEELRKSIELDLSRTAGGEKVLARWALQRRSREDGFVDVPRSLASLI
tara:strand:+ start:245 stop:1129 length:885 start_codon:yes stop_codon:yes gene_type:complete